MKPDGAEQETFVALSLHDVVRLARKRGLGEALSESRLRSWIHGRSKAPSGFLGLDRISLPIH